MISNLAFLFPFITLLTNNITLNHKINYMKTPLLIVFILIVNILQSQITLESSVSQSFNGTSFINDVKSNFQYDSNNNLTLVLGFNWYNSMWNESEMNLYNYNEANKIVEHILQYNNNAESQWQNEARELYSYNAQGFLTEIIYQYWTGALWQNSSKIVFAYSNGKISTATTYELQFGNWINDSKSNVSYNSNNLAQILEEDWSNNQFAWQTNYRNIFTFNSNNKMLTNIYEDWLSPNWEEEEKLIYELDSYGNRISETELFDGVNAYKDVYTYDTSILMETIQNPFMDKSGVDYFYEDAPFVSKVLTRTSKSYDSDTNSFSDDSITTYNYITTPLATNNNGRNESVIIYPNPTSKYLIIKGLIHEEKVYIFSINGAKTLETTVNENEAMNIENLSNGMYFLKLESGKTFKFIKN